MTSWASMQTLKNEEFKMFMTRFRSVESLNSYMSSCDEISVIVKTAEFSAFWAVESNFCQSSDFSIWEIIKRSCHYHRQQSISHFIDSAAELSRSLNSRQSLETSFQLKIFKSKSLKTKKTSPKKTFISSHILMPGTITAKNLNDEIQTWKNEAIECLTLNKRQWYTQHRHALSWEK